MCPAGEEGVGVTMEENVIELKNVEKTFRDFWLRPLAHAVRGLDLEVRSARRRSAGNPAAHPAALR